MSANMEEVQQSLFTAVKNGDLQKVKRLVNRHGLSYCPNWSNGYIFLCHAIKFKRVDVAKFLLQRGAQVNCQNVNEDSPLHWAARKGYLNLVRMLIDRNADIDALNMNDKTPLHLATEERCKKVVQVLLDRGAYCCPRNIFNMEPLLTAVNFNYPEIVDIILSFRQRHKVFNPQPLHSALHKASARGWEAVVLSLLNANADPNEVIDPCLTSSSAYADYFKRGLSPLLLACEGGYTRIVNLLLKHGAEVNCVRPQDNYTPLHVASEEGMVEIAGLLLHKGANPNAVAANNLTPLHLVIKRGMSPHSMWNFTGKKHCLKKFFDKLFSNGANLNAQTDTGATPLLLALEHKHDEVIEWLLKHGACVNVKDGNNLSPLYWALRNRDWSQISLILQHKPVIDDGVNELVLRIALGGDGHTEMANNLYEYIFTAKHGHVTDSDLLPAAVMTSRTKVVENILAIGIDPNDEKYDSSLLQYAVRGGHVEIVEMLLKSGCKVNSKRKEDTKTPLCYLFYHNEENKYLKIIKLLLAHGADIRKAPDLLHTAVEEENMKICEFLIKNGACVNGRSTWGDKPLHCTVPTIKGFMRHQKEKKCCKMDEIKRVEIARLLLSNGASVNCVDVSDLTTLHLAAAHGCSRLALLLLKFKADVNKKYNDSCSPLHFAVKAGHEDVAEILLINRADVNAPLVDSNQRPLHIAAHSGRLEMVKLLLRFDADMNALDRVGNTALHCAIRQNQHDIVETLLASGCNVAINTQWGTTPLDLLVKFFIDAGNNIYFELYRDPSYYDNDKDVGNIRGCNRISDIVIDTVVNHVNKLRASGIRINISKNTTPLISSVLYYRDSEFNRRSNNGVIPESKCREEVEKMRCVKLCSDLTLYDILMHRLESTFVVSKTIVNTLESFDFDDFPIYRNLIEGWLEKCQWMMTLLRKGQKYLNVLIKTSTLHQQCSPHLPVELLEEIISYLDKRDLYSLVFCGKALKKQLR